jgi:hypothetical protein
MCPYKFCTTKFYISEITIKTTVHSLDVTRMPDKFTVVRMYRLVDIMQRNLHNY